MKKTIIILTIAILAVAAFLYLNSHKNTSSVSSSGIILFYGIGCPHCKNVEDFMAQNNVTDKIQIDQREVFANRNNAKLMGEKAVQCGMNKDNLGVPLLWVNGKCYSGDQDIIQYFKDQINGKQ